MLVSDVSKVGRKLGSSRLPSFQILYARESLRRAFTLKYYQANQLVKIVFFFTYSEYNFILFKNDVSSIG